MSSKEFDETLERIHINDPVLQRLVLGIKTETEPLAVLPGNISNWTRLGDEVGQNIHLKEILIGYPGTGTYAAQNRITIAAENLEAFCFGFVNNRSLEKLHILNIDFPNFVDLFQVLGPFFESNHNLTHFSTGCVRLGRKEIDSLLPNIFRSDSLTSLYIWPRYMGDDLSGDFISDLMQMTRLRELTLKNIDLGSEGYKALEMMLLKPDNRLEELNLSDCKIDDNGLLNLSRGLKGNRSLKLLDIYRSDCKYTANGVDHLANALRLSNHNLAFLYTASSATWPGDLRTLLKLNARDDDKRFVVIRKAFLYNFLCGSFDAHPIEDIEHGLLIQLLPHLLANIGRIGKDGRSQKQRLSGIFHFIRNKPLLVAEHIVRKNGGMGKLMDGFSNLVLKKGVS